MEFQIIATYQSKVPGRTPINTITLCEDSDGQGPSQEDNERLEPMDEVFRPPGIERRPSDSHIVGGEEKDEGDGGSGA